MSAYLIKGKGWRYEFVMKGERYTKAWFKTKTEAKQAEAKKREELKNPKPVQEKPIDMAFFDLVNLRLNYVESHNSAEHYRSYLYLGRRWVKKWGELMCSEITPKMVERHLEERLIISAYTANKDLRYLRATINYGLKKNYISNNPAEGFDFFPVEKKVKYVPPIEDIDKVIAVAKPDDQDFLWIIQETMARVGEINKLLWEDVDLERRFIEIFQQFRYLAMGFKSSHSTLRNFYGNNL